MNAFVIVVLLRRNHAQLWRSQGQTAECVCTGGKERTNMGAMHRTSGATAGRLAIDVRVHSILFHFRGRATSRNSQQAPHRRHFAKSRLENEVRL